MKKQKARAILFMKMKKKNSPSIFFNRLLVSLVSVLMSLGSSVNVIMDNIVVEKHKFCLIDHLRRNL